MPERVLKSDAARVDAPSAAEWRFTYVVLLAATVIPGMAAKYGVPNDMVVRVFWSLAYVIAGRQLLRRKAQVQELIGPSWLLWTLLTLVMVSVLWSINPSTTMIDGIELLGTTLIGFYIATRFTLVEFLKIFALVFGTIACMSLALIFLSPGHGHENWGAGPWDGIYQDKNSMGAASALSIVSQLILWPSVAGRGRWLLAFGLLLSGVLLVGASSATAFGDCVVVALAVLAAVSFRSPKFGGFARFAAVLGLIIALASVFVFGVNTDTIYSALGRSSDLTSRADFWPYLREAIADRPVLGYGYDAFFQSPLSREYLSTFIVEAGGWTPYHAHDSVLQTELDIGYVGLATLALLVTVSFWRALAYFGRERRSYAIWPFAIILFLTVGSYTETYYLNFNSQEWILFVAAIVYPLQRTASVAVRTRAKP